MTTQPSDTTNADPSSGLQALRRFAAPTVPRERCALCSAPLPPEHDHLVDPAQRRLVCACVPCAILFSRRATMKFKRIPRRIRAVDAAAAGASLCDALGIPIGLAFFFRDSTTGRTIAIYPSPAGPTESLLDLGHWDQLARDNPALESIEPDTEALLVNRTREGGEGEKRGGDRCFIVPIDECYRLVGLVRLHWQGIAGGPRARAVIDEFFDALARRAIPAREPRRA